MTELTFSVGFALGAIITGCASMLLDYRKKVKRTVELEKEHALLEQHVRKAVNCIDNIVHGSKHE